jgi:hypothetical protein
MITLLTQKMIEEKSGTKIFLCLVIIRIVFSVLMEYYC